MLYMFDNRIIDCLWCRCCRISQTKIKYVFRTDFGGSGRVNGRPIRSYPVSCHHLSHSIVVDIPPMTGLVLKLVRQQPKLPAKGRKTR